MQDGHTANASFREVDEQGNALPHDPAAAPEETRKFRVNPFIVVLWILNGALMVLVGWVISESLEPTFFGGTTPQSGAVPVFFFLMNSIPQILPLPLVTTVALLFWHSWQWQKRRAA